MRTTTHGGVTVGIGITPLGWSRLFTISAAAIRGQVISLSTLLPTASCVALLVVTALGLVDVQRNPLDFLTAPRAAVRRRTRLIVTARATALDP